MSDVSGSDRIAKFDEILKDEYSVVLLQGRNTLGDYIYVYVKVGLRDIRRLDAVLGSPGTFSPLDFGAVIAAGHGEPPDQIRQRVGRRYPLLDTPRRFGRAADQAGEPPALASIETQVQRWQRFYEEAVSRLADAESRFAASGSAKDRSDVVRALLLAADQAMFVARWRDAVSWARRSMELSPDVSPAATGILATGLLFQGVYDEAVRVFREHLGDESGDQSLGGQAYENFELLELAGITCMDVARLKADLGPPPVLKPHGDAERLKAPVDRKE